jgi:hypothetical protein
MEIQDLLAEFRSSEPAAVSTAAGLPSSAISPRQP